MSLIADVRAVCRRLAPLGWHNALKQHGLDIASPNLARELARPLPNIQRGNTGYEDFAPKGVRGIEPGIPALSLLYHALASPGVVEGTGAPRLEDFPTLAELDVVENYIFAAAHLSLEDLRRRYRGRRLAVVVFAYEYRPAAGTCHRRHADFVFARTGVARVGTVGPLYRARFRGFVPYDDSDTHAIRVCPARYAAFIAVKSRGSKTDCCPMRFMTPDTERSGALANQASDSARHFWLPVHKLFAGPECLQGLNDASVTLTPYHVNEKIRRVHLALLSRTARRKAAASGVFDHPPFRFTQDIAAMATGPSLGPGVLVPVPHATLVEPADINGRPLTYLVPRMGATLSSSVNIPAPRDNVRHAPEYVHARTKVESDGRLQDLNKLADPARAVHHGGYHALNYRDHTGDGWIAAQCPWLAVVAPDLARPIAAYSLVTAPDFFFACDQRDLTEWTATLPKPFVKSIWVTSPTALSDQRLPANLQLPGSPFHPSDATVTALVSMAATLSPRRANAAVFVDFRHCHLPDDSAGVFAPGWDVSADKTLAGVGHLAAYGLGSPFPEDAKLCAALSTFWPAVAPDATRTFTYGARSGAYFLVSPLTDDEIGQLGRLPWDGIPGPVVVKAGGRSYAEYHSFDHADYVHSARHNLFSLAVTSHIDGPEYEARALAMALLYRALGVETTWAKTRRLVLSFRPVAAGDPELIAAQTAAGSMLPGSGYRFDTFKAGATKRVRNRPNRERIPIRDRAIAFVDPANRRVLVRRGNSRWRAVQLDTL